MTILNARLLSGLLSPALAFLCCLSLSVPADARSLSPLVFDVDTISVRFSYADKRATRACEEGISRTDTEKFIREYLIKQLKKDRPDILVSPDALVTYPKKVANKEKFILFLSFSLKVHSVIGEAGDLNCVGVVEETTSRESLFPIRPSYSTSVISSRLSLISDLKEVLRKRLDVLGGALISLQSYEEESKSSRDRREFGRIRRELRHLKEIFNLEETIK